MKRTFRMVLLVAGFSCVLCGCGGKPAPPPGKHVIRIGLLLDSVVVERWHRDRDIFSAKAKELGAEVIVQNCNEDNATQEQQIREMANDGVDVLVVIPYDKDGLSDDIRAVRKKGIPVLSYDRLIRNAGVDLYVSFDNVRVGDLMGSELLKKVPKGRYVIINGSPLDNNSALFNQGYRDALSDALQKNAISILSETWAEAWRPENAYTVVHDLLVENKQIDAVIAANDGLAGGAIRALAENRLAGLIPVVGHDADLSACQRIAEGTQYLTVYKPIKELAQSAAIAAVQLARGEVPEAGDSIGDGSGDVPYIKFQPILVTRENLVQTVIRDGFHSYDDVFRNVPESDRPARE